MLLMLLKRYFCIWRVEIFLASWNCLFLFWGHPTTIASEAGDPMSRSYLYFIELYTSMFKNEYSETKIKSKSVFPFSHYVRLHILMETIQVVRLVRWVHSKISYVLQSRMMLEVWEEPKWSTSERWILLLHCKYLKQNSWSQFLYKCAWKYITKNIFNVAQSHEK